MAGASGGTVSAMPTPSAWKNYRLSLALIAGILLGSLAGWLLEDRAAALKPLGDLLLNALFVTVVPLVFFSIASAVATMAGTGRLGKVLGWMIVLFVLTGIVSSGVMMLAVQLVPPAEGVALTTSAPANVSAGPAADRIVRALTAPDFVDLLSKRNLLALIVFAAVVGLAASATGSKARAFIELISSANAVLMKVVSYIMLYAPVGLAGYFAYLVGVFGPKLLGSYLRAMALYYPVCLLYAAGAFTAYTYLAGRLRGVRAFWANIPPAAVTALATGSSFATIPVNLQAAERIGIPADIREVVLPIGATIHMDGSCLAAVLKIAFVFGLYGMDFTSAGAIATAIGIAILSGTVMSGIPGGGFAGEVLIVTMYSLPGEALPILAMIGTLVDPPATMVNATGDTVASMMIARILGGKKWMGEA